MKYRKKPVVIEAFQYDGDMTDSCGNFYAPIWAAEAMKENILFYDGSELYVKTLEGNMLVSVNDFVIKGVNGELYPCKPDIFEKTYEEVNE